MFSIFCLEIFFSFFPFIIEAEYFFQDKSGSRGNTTERWTLAKHKATHMSSELEEWVGGGGGGQFGVSFTDREFLFIIET